MSFLVCTIILAVIFVVFLIFFRSSKLTKLLGVLLIFAFFILYDSYTAENGDLKFFNNPTKLSSSVTKIPKGSSIYLSSGFTAYATTSDNTFVLTENIKVDDLKEFLGSTKKNVYFCIKEGSKILFSYNFGICGSSDADKIMKTYKKVERDNSIKKVTYRYYAFDFIYYDKEVVANVCK